MKLLLSCMLIFGALSANASLSDIIKKAAGLNNSAEQTYTPMRPRPPRPGNPYDPGNPYEPGYPDRPERPDRPQQGVTCVAEDRGHEEHGGGHYSCRECLREHGECIETCSRTAVECQVDGIDRYGRRIAFVGRGQNQWRAEDKAMEACYYEASNCRLMRCQQQNQAVSRRMCR